VQNRKQLSRWFVLAIFQGCAVLCYPVRADTIKVSKSTRALDFGSSVVFYIDSFGEPDIISQFETFFTKTQVRPFVAGAYNGGDIWCGFTLQNQSSEQEAFVLEVSGANEVRVYYRKVGTKRFESKLTGVFIPYPTNEMGDSRFIKNKINFQLDSLSFYEFIALYPDPGVTKIVPKFVVSSMQQWRLMRYDSTRSTNITLLPFLGVCFVDALINFFLKTFF
jgi:hypothetical protein